MTKTRVSFDSVIAEPIMSCMQRKYIPLLILCSFGATSLAPLAWGQTFQEKKQYALVSDGPDKGRDSYALIKKTFGDKAIESPDLFRSNHTSVKHIIEATDDIVGPHFVFLAHRDLDKDRDKDITDRQRNEIKVYDKSRSGLKAYKGETMQYRWKFKVDNGFEFSKNFTHFFQIKAKNFKKTKNPKDSDQFPVITITASDRGESGNRLQLRHSPSLDADGNRIKFKALLEEDMSRFTGQWIEFFVQITFDDTGVLIFQAKNIETDELLVNFRDDGIDMWRGEHKSDFSRPKWGIYRSLKNKDSLRSEEEKARFADFSIRKGEIE